MLQALVEGGQSPAEMAQSARRRMRRKLRELELALSGRVEEHHRFLLGVQMRRIEAAEADLAELDKRLREKLAPYSKQLRLLMRIPGVDWIIAATIIAEIGVDMSAFANAAHLAPWTAICPGNHHKALAGSAVARHARAPCTSRRHSSSQPLPPPRHAARTWLTSTAA
jgi:transposase